VVSKEIPEYVLRVYGIGPQARAFPFGSGHIHRTFLVSEVNRQFIFQRINHHIFTDVDALMENICAVTAYIRERVTEDKRPATIEVVKTQTSLTHVQDEEGYWWRALAYIGGSHTVDVPHNTQMAYEAGKTLGRFYKLLDGFQPQHLHVVLPRFHELGYRLQQFHTALEDASEQRKARASELIRLVEEKADSLLWPDRLIASNALPLRVVHNDPKINNVLLDEMGHGICMIDLDTVMPGCLLHDFGDALRTTANPAAEDETDLTKVRPDIQLFEAYTQGFLDQTQSMLFSAEKEYLHRAPAFLTFVIALRFLTDYLNNDVYYHVSHPEHNLERARAQFALYQGFEESEPKLKEIVDRILH
jgi:Ser/Thr protein kinase RdoA (MazF antagonist)